MIQKLGFLNFIRKDFKFREKDRQMRETHQSSLLGMPWRKVDHYYKRF